MEASGDEVSDTGTPYSGWSTTPSPSSPRQVEEGRLEDVRISPGMNSNAGPLGMGIGEPALPVPSARMTLFADQQAEESSTISSSAQSCEKEGIILPQKRPRTEASDQDVPRRQLRDVLKYTKGSRPMAPRHKKQKTTNKEVKKDGKLILARVAQYSKHFHEVIAEYATRERPLSTEQIKVLQWIDQGCSIFLTGAAGGRFILFKEPYLRDLGTGKSFVLRAAVTMLQRKYPSIEEVAVTATTGIASALIGGTTINHWGGLGKMSGDGSQMYKEVRKKQLSWEKWHKVKVLFIDEGTHERKDNHND
jgi:hypothetical protein